MTNFPKSGLRWVEILRVIITLYIPFSPSAAAVRSEYVEWMEESVVIYRYYIHRGLIWALYLAPNEVRCLWQRFIRVTLPTLG